MDESLLIKHAILNKKYIIIDQSTTSFSKNSASQSMHQSWLLKNIMFIMVQYLLQGSLKILKPFLFWLQDL